MAKGLEEVIEDLIDEIVLEGNQGWTATKVSTYISGSHSNSAGQQSSNNSANGENTSLVQLSEQVWKRLLKHPDLHLQINKENLASRSGHLQPLSETKNTKDVTLVPSLHKQNSPDILGIHGISRLSQYSCIYVRKNRIRQVLCSHVKDKHDLSELDLRLLLIIAKHRHGGVTPEVLAIESEEEKGSVTKSHEFLETKGYITHYSTQKEDATDLHLVHARFSSTHPASANLADRKNASRSRIGEPDSQKEMSRAQTSLSEPNQVSSPDRSHVEAEIETDTSDQPNTTAASNKTKANHKVAPKRGKKHIDAKGRGRPRRFLQGTEKFWQEQFAVAREQANPGTVFTNRTGSMVDPAGVTLFANRPATFDEVLVRALDQGLPIPQLPQNITQNWVDLTLYVLDRTEPGIYITPPGQQPNGWKIDRPVSQVLIFKSRRLKEVDFSTVFKVAKVRHLASSAAHTFHYMRYYPNMPTKLPTYLSLEDQEKQELAEHGLMRGFDFDYFPSSPYLVRPKFGLIPIEMQSKKRKRKAKSTGVPPEKRRRLTAEANDLPPSAVGRSEEGRDMELLTSLETASTTLVSPGPLMTRSARRQILKEQGRLTDTENQTGKLSRVMSNSYVYYDDASFAEEAAEEQGSDDDYDLESPPKSRRVSRGGTITLLRRNAVLEIVNSCSGAIPYNATFPINIFLKMLGESGQGVIADSKAFRATVKSLCDAGHLRQLKFSFRTQRGSMVIRNILTEPHIDATSEFIRQLERDIIAADPWDHVPPEMEHFDGYLPSGPKPRGNFAIGEKQPDTSNAFFLVLQSSRRPLQNPMGSNKVSWMQLPGEKTLPTSLEEIVGEGDLAGKYNSSKADLQWSRFEREVDTVMMWEHRTFEHFAVNLEWWNFINHTIGDVEGPGFAQLKPLQFTEPIWFDSSGKEVSYPFSLADGSLLSRKSLRLKQRKPLTTRGPLSVTPIIDRFTGHTNVRFRRTQDWKRREDARAVKRQRLATQYQEDEPMYVTDPHGNLVDMSGETVQPIKRPRGVQYLRMMDEKDVYRIAVSVVVVRTLAGGLEKYIDWSLVMMVFSGEEEQFIRDRWKTLSNRYRRDISGLTESLQEKYLKAFQQDRVPGVDFEDLKSTEWGKIVDWAIQELDRFSSVGVDELPGSMEEFTVDKEFAFEEFKGMREVLAYNVNAAVPRKEETASSTPFAIPLFPRQFNSRPIEFLHPTEEEQKNPLLEKARTWVVATVLTKQSNYHSAAIQKKFRTLGPTLRAVDDLIEQALKGLQRDKIITRNRLGKPRAGMFEGGWEVSFKFYEYFDQKRMITRKMLRTAALWKKEVLDQVMLPQVHGDIDGEGGAFKIHKDSMLEDGQMVALLNLLSTGRIKLDAGADLPKGRYGLDWQTKGYQTRLIDKTVLGFGVVFRPAAGAYVAGNPLADRHIAIPRGEIDARGRIPAWFDIMAHFQPELWEMFVSTVVGLVSVRSGIDGLEIARTLNFALSTWEVELVLDWLEKAGYIARTPSGKAWKTREWWWLVLAHGLDGWHA